MTAGNVIQISSKAEKLIRKTTRKNKTIKTIFTFTAINRLNPDHRAGTAKTKADLRLH